MAYHILEEAEVESFKTKDELKGYMFGAGAAHCCLHREPHEHSQPVSSVDAGVEANVPSYEAEPAPERMDESDYRQLDRPDEVPTMKPTHRPD